jgi:DNA replication and repair protein RecF
MDDADARPENSIPPRECVGLALTAVRLSHFRSYARAAIAVEAAPVVLAGANGTGKTNLLEAISLLSPGRGLRGAKLADLQRKAPAEAEASDSIFAESLWAVSATVARPDGEWEIGTGLTARPQAAARASRTLHLNGAAAAGADLAEVLPMLWLTPALDRLFLEGAGERRRFLDRLTYALTAPHARRAARYERAMHERLRLLREGGRDPVWLDGLEQTMAKEGSQITRARRNAILRLNGELSLRGSREGAFPCAQLALQDSLGDKADDADALRDALAASRSRDAEAGRSLIGPHTADLDVRHTAKRAPARECSTGEQKALLVSIVLANAWLQTKRHDGIAPLLLLDEIAAHLDSMRRAALFEEICALKAQAWLTGTDKNLFSSILSHAQCFSIAAGSFLRED